MPPRKVRKSKRIVEVEKNNSSHEHEEISEIAVEPLDSNTFKPQSSTEYFEFHDLDLKPSHETENFKEISSEVDSFSSANRTRKVSESAHQRIISRKIKLNLRKVHLMCDLVSSQIFVAKQLKNDELTALSLSCLPPHILRIFNTSLISEEKTLKNSLAMFATWWKNNIGSRVFQTANYNFKMYHFKKKFEMKSSLLTKSAYEDDSVKLFTMICHGLGLKIRFVHSLDLIPATVAKNSSNNLTKIQHFPRYWLEVYSNLEQKWITVDCIQGFVDEKNRLDNKSKPHSFVLSVDDNGFFYDLTEKYSTDYQEKSFKLRKEEDKWLKELLSQLNLNNNSSSKVLNDKDSNIDIENIEIPKTLSAIKNHPILMLESQLKKYEVFYPNSYPFGYFKDEAVFLKENAKKVRSKDAWLSQCARVIKDGEEPAKFVNLPRKAGAPVDEPTGIQPLYGEWQTDPYVPPEVIDGKIPRNDHGNVDLFQPSMLPMECVHVTLPGAWKVARYIGIDYADACIGFSFHGGRALPAIKGIVITNSNYEIFKAEYKNKLIESFKNDAHELEKQIAQKWTKIIKNALIAKRLMHDSSLSLSESLISAEGDRSHDLVQNISTFSTSTINAHESEIEEFDAI